MTEACIQYAQVMLSTEPKSGIGQMTVQQGADGLAQAAATARTAASHDAKWAGAPAALSELAQALRTTNSSAMASALDKVRAICNPLIAGVAASSTTQP